MTTVAPPPPPAPPAPPPPPPLTVAVSAPSSEIARLAIGALLETVALNSPPRGPLLVETAAGPLALQTTLRFPERTPLAFTVDGQGGQTTLRFTTIAGKPATPALLAQFAQSAALPTARGALTAGAAPTTDGGIAGPGGAGTTASPPVMLTQGSTLRAILLRPAGGSALTGAGQPTGRAATAAGQAGTPGTASTTPSGQPAGPRQLFSSPTPAGPPTPPSTGTAQPFSGPRAAFQLPARPGGAAPQAPPSAETGGRPGLVLANLPSGSPLQVRIVATAPPGTPLPAVPPGVTGHLITGTVGGTTAAGQMILDADDGLLALESRALLPEGTRIRLELAEPAAGRASAEAGARPVIEVLTRAWPVLDEAIEVLRQADPALAQRLTTAVLPRPDANLGASLLFFMAALRGGELRSWLGGDALRELQSRRPELAERLGEDFKALGRLSASPQPGDWRLFALPMLAGHELHQIRLLVRDSPESDERDDSRKRPKETRFVLDVELTRLGRMQLDGLIRGGRTFDLILRTGEPLPGTMRDDIRAIFRQASEITGISGGITFQHGGRFVEVPREAVIGPGVPDTGMSI